MYVFAVNVLCMRRSPSRSALENLKQPGTEKNYTKNYHVVNSFSSWKSGRESKIFRLKLKRNDKRNNAQVQNLTLKIDFGIFILANGAGQRSSRRKIIRKIKPKIPEITSCHVPTISLCAPLLLLPLDSLISLQFLWFLWKQWRSK